MIEHPARIPTLIAAAALIVAPAFATTPPAHAQQSSADPATQEAAWPAAALEDVATIDAIVASLYDVISGPAGEARDWDRFRSLFLPEAHMVPTGIGTDGRPGHYVWTVEDYVRRAGPSLEETGFFEREIHRVTERFGEIAQVFSTYESRWKADDPEPFQRGINSIQLFHDGERWWIVNVMWEGEREGLPIPARFGGS